MPSDKRRTVYSLAAVVVLAFFACGSLGDNQTKPQGPPIPITITQRNDALKDGKVIQFRNTGNITLSVVIKCENRTFKETQRFKAVLKPGESREVGWVEGWMGRPGEIVTVSSDEYMSATYVIKE